MFIKKLHNVRQKIAALTLTVFSVVFICDFLCNLGIVNKSLIHKNNTHHSHEVTISKLGHDHHSFLFEKAATFSQMESPSIEDCCKEEINRFYASLINYENPGFDLNQELIIHHTLVWNHFSHIIIYKETNPYKLNSSLSPPITGLYACILFQSFLC